MGDRNLNELLKWSLAHSAPPATPSNNNDPNSKIQGSAPATTSTAAAAAAEPTGDRSSNKGLSTEALAALFGGPSEAELMQQSMAAITSPEISVDNKMVAFDNLEQLIESLDNANLLSKLGLWTPLLEQLAHEDAGIRKMAAWCVGTAVQNNSATQERLLALGGIERLVGMVAKEVEVEGEKKEEKDVKKKAVYAISSAVRNYQPAMDVVTSELAKLGKREKALGTVDAMDMDAVDVVIGKLRDEINAT